MQSLCNQPHGDVLRTRGVVGSLLFLYNSQAERRLWLVRGTAYLEGTDAVPFDWRVLE